MKPQTDAVIRILPEILSNQIAAGEVVQRPASVVKELVENSMDAGADLISIEIEKGGRALIRISDNGMGMTRDQAMLAIERYATSKIFSKEDLFSISTFGFRGEALPSIASVSKFTLVSRPKENTEATKIEISGGKLTKVSDAGAPAGTMIEVARLFFNTPARRKFLKAESTENSHISDTVSGLAMGNPKIGFRLFMNKKLIRNFPKGQDTFQRAQQLLGKEAASQLYPLEYKDAFLSISGVCANPGMTRSTANRIYLFVNSRLVKDPGLVKALFQGYRGRIMKGRYPMGVVCIELPFEQVDVNVHPTKREVKFINPQPVYRALTRAVEESMAQAQVSPLSYARSGPVPNSGDGSALFPDRDKQEALGPLFGRTDKAGLKEPDWVKSQSPKISQSSAIFSEVRPSRKKSPREKLPRDLDEDPQVQVPLPNLDEEKDSSGESPHPKETDREEIFIPEVSVSPQKVAEPSTVWDLNETTDPNLPTPPSPKTSKGDHPKVIAPETPPSVGQKEAPGDHKIIGQVMATYIVVEKQGHLVLVDQHAAHERITYEALKKRHENLGIQRQDLMVPEVLELTHQEANVLEGILGDLAGLGVKIEPFGGTSFVIKSIPVLLEDRAVGPFVMEVIEQLACDNGSGEKDKWLDDCLVTMACHRAIRANKPMNFVEMDQLIKDLWTCDNPMHCPHGRPILISFDRTQLEKLFKRVV